MIIQVPPMPDYPKLAPTMQEIRESYSCPCAKPIILKTRKGKFIIGKKSYKSIVVPKDDKWM